MTLNDFILGLSYTPLPMFEGEGEGGSAITGAGTQGDDTLEAGSGDDTVEGGNDTVDGDDTTEGGSGDDTVKSGEGDDTVSPVTADDLVIPENFEIPDEAQTEILGLLNDPELSRADFVNKMIEMQSEAMAASLEEAVTANQQAWDNTQTEWQTALKSIPNFGGEALDEHLAQTKKGLEAAGAGQEFFDALDMTGAGNHPALVPMLHKLIKPYLEGTPVSGNPPKGKGGGVAAMYPSMQKD
jgi:Ca2+-binding RTX toxin-like protein